MRLMCVSQTGLTLLLQLPTTVTPVGLTYLPSGSWGEGGRKKKKRLENERGRIDM